MEPVRSRSVKSILSAFRTAWLNCKDRVSRRSPLKRERPKTLVKILPQTSSNSESQLSVVDFLDGKGELSYTTVVEGLEEFVYQTESAPVA